MGRDVQEAGGPEEVTTMDVEELLDRIGTERMDRLTRCEYG